jgi:hypothetical protein
MHELAFIKKFTLIFVIHLLSNYRMIVLAEQCLTDLVYLC